MIEAIDSCTLSVPTDKIKYKFNLVQGVDISSKENLSLDCMVTNTGKEAITATPAFETHFRTIYGKIVEAETPESKPFSFPAGKSTPISIILPKPTTPQAYDVKASLVYSNQSSNTITAHYVLQGISATIQNLSLDKDYYDKGDKANILFSWSPSADNFPGSRLAKASITPEVSILANITNGHGASCANTIKQVLSDKNTMNTVLGVSIKQSCENPKISVSLTDNTGKVLDQRDFNITTVGTHTPKSDYSSLIAISILALILAIFLCYLKKKGHKNTTGDDTPVAPIAMIALIITLISFGIIYPLLKARADTVNLGTGTVIVSGNGGLTEVGLIVNFDQAAYDPGSQIGLTATAQYYNCTNVTRYFSAVVYLVDDKGNQVTNRTPIFNTALSGQGQIVDYVSVAVPSTPGTYTLKVEISGYYPYIATLYDSPNLFISPTADFNFFKYLLSSSVTYLLYQHYGNNIGDQETNTINAITNAIGNASDIQTVADIFPQYANILPIRVNNYSLYGFEKYGSGGSLEFTRLYSIPVPIREVTVYANDQTGSVSTPPNAELRISWTSLNSSWCTCNYKDTNGATVDCTPDGLTARTFPAIKAKGSPFYNISKSTAFNVHCE